MAREDNTLGGRVFFEMLPESQFTESKREAFYNRIKAELGDAFETYDEPSIYECSLVVACTEKIEFKFKGRERKALKDFANFWPLLQTFNAVEIMDWWLKLPSTILNAWRREWNDAQEMFDVDPAELPSSMLTAAQKKEAENPTSPLP